MTCGRTAVALWIAAGAGPKEVATRAGHTSVSFTLDRYGHLYPEADRALRARLDRFRRLAMPNLAATRTMDSESGDDGLMAATL
jgi:hypothetical protein